MQRQKAREKREQKSVRQIKQEFIQKSIERGPTKMCHAMPLRMCVSASVQGFFLLFALFLRWFFRFLYVASASSFRISSEFGFGPGTSIIRERKVSCSGRFYILRRLSLASFCFSCSLFVFFYSSSSPATLSSLCRCGGGSVDTGMDKDSREREQMPLDSWLLKLQRWSWCCAQRVWVGVSDTHSTYSSHTWNECRMTTSRGVDAVSHPLRWKKKKSDFVGKKTISPVRSAQPSARSATVFAYARIYA